MTGEVLFNLLAIFIPLLAIVVVFRGVKQDSYMSASVVDDWAGSYVHDVKRNGNTILSAELITQFVKGLTELIRLGIVLVPIILVFLPLVYEVFPAARNAVEPMFSAFNEKIMLILQGALAAFPIIFMWGVSAVIAHYIIKFFRIFFDEIEAGRITLPGFDADWAGITFHLIRATIIILTILIVYTQTPGSNTPTVQGVIVLTSLLAGLGAQDVIKNIFSGLVLTYAQSFDVGDVVQIGGVKGTVTETTLLRTVVQTVDRRVVSLPNKKVLDNQVENLSTIPHNLVKASVVVRYDVPWRKVHDLLIEAARVSPDLDTDEVEPFVFQVALEDFYVRYNLYAFTKTNATKLRGITSRLYQTIQDNFERENIHLGAPIEESIRLLSKETQEE